MSLEREAFEQIDFDDIGLINQCAAVKEKRILGLKLSAEPKTFYPNNQKMPLVSDINVFYYHFGHGKYRHRMYGYKSFNLHAAKLFIVTSALKRGVVTTTPLDLVLGSRYCIVYT